MVQTILGLSHQFLHLLYDFYTSIDFGSALQLEMNLINTASGEKQEHDGEVVVEADLPYDFQELAGNKDIIVIHFGKATEVIPAERVMVEEEWDDQPRWEGRIRFALHGFSPVIIAVGDKPVKVLLESSEAGAGAIFEEVAGFNEDGDFRVSKRTYLPAGQEVDVPKGTLLRLGSMDPYRWDYYDPKGYEVTEDGKEPRLYSEWEDYSIEADEKVVIRPVYEKVADEDEKAEYRIRFRDDKGGNWPNPAQVSGTLELQRYNAAAGRYETITGTDWGIEDRSVGGYEPYNPSEIFEIIEGGQIRIQSKEELTFGSYWGRAECRIPEGGTVRGYFEFTVGVETYAAVYLGEWQDESGRETELLSDYYGIDIHGPGKTLGDSLTTMQEEDDSPAEIAMFGYSNYGWYEDGNLGREVGLEKAINENIDVIARFYNVDANGNKVWYEQKSTSGSGDIPVNPGRPGGGSGGSGGGGGGGSRSSAGADTMSGNWQNDERGWRFQMVGGGYATNTWGRINGSWYYFGADTYMMTGWIFVGEQWYYLNPEKGDHEGKMKTGWIFDPGYGKWFYMNPSGAMQSGWQKIGNVWYYLNPVSDGTKGVMLADQWIGDYYVDANGAWVETMTR